MKFIKDEKIPFTCMITKEYCRNQIENLSLQLNDKMLLSLPVSPTLSNKITRRVVNKIKKSVLTILKEQI